ncbi:MAG: complex I NDUFA9 subunit family protein [Alphaproteobacteria bacterium]|nr:complex I NDUFA9 subunit family protein [Alphaproteobacteria bacterium]
MSLVTVFGGSGFIGRQVVKRLADKGVDVRVAVRDPEAALSTKTMGNVGQITPVQANLRDRDSVAAGLAGATGVVNLVGILYQGGKQRFRSIQAEGAGLVAAEAASAGVERLVHVSALGAAKDSRSEYARTKWAGEEAVRAAFPKAAILRPSVVFGPGDGFFNRFARMARLPLPLPVFGCPSFPKIDLEARTIDVYGDGGTKFQPVHVGDVAAAAVKCLDDDAAEGRTYELGGPIVYSFCEVMRLVLRETRRRRPLVPIPFWYASCLAFFLEWLPTPPLTRDQVALLRRDNVLSGEAPGLAELGIEATAAEVVLPTYLDVHRRGGRYTRTQPV